MSNRDFGEAETSVGIPPSHVIVLRSPFSTSETLDRLATLAGLDLPLRALAWTDDAGDTWLSYVDPDHLHARYQISRELTSRLEGIHALCRDAVADDARSQVTDGS